MVIIINAIVLFAYKATDDEQFNPELEIPEAILVAFGCLQATSYLLFIFIIVILTVPLEYMKAADKVKKRKREALKAPSSRSQREKKEAVNERAGRLLVLLNYLKPVV